VKLKNWRTIGQARNRINTDLDSIYILCDMYIKAISFGQNFQTNIPIILIAMKLNLLLETVH